MANKAIEELTCIHVWKIETANGPYSKGQCSKCKEVKSFKNSMPDPRLSLESDTTYKNKRGRKKAGSEEEYIDLDFV